MKVCSICKKEKNEEEFYIKIKKTGQRQSHCKSCHNIYCIERWKQRKLDAIKYLGGKCVRCGYNKHYSALEFHHKDHTEKEFEWNKMRLLAEEKMKKELDKCELVCSNCHKEIHWS